MDASPPLDQARRTVQSVRAPLELTLRELRNAFSTLGHMMKLTNAGVLGQIPSSLRAPSCMVRRWRVGLTTIAASALPRSDEYG
jgi:hypothetical protein